MTRFTLPLILIVLVFNVCQRNSRENLNVNKPGPIQTKNDLSRETVKNGIEVTFYPAYGYRDGADWVIPIRTWVHKIGDSTGPTQLEKLKAKAAELTTASICAMEGNALNSRLRDFSADDVDGQQIEITFDSGPNR